MNKLETTPVDLVKKHVVKKTEYNELLKKVKNNYSYL